MKGVFVAISMGLAAAFALFPSGEASPPTEQTRNKNKPDSDAPEITGPFTHENLTIYLVHGPDVLKNQFYLTLQEALDQKKVIVHETGHVQQLAIENISDRDAIFLQAGDIVRGGKQDRVIADDLIAMPKSGKIPINSFCVEQGRWTRRGGEASDRFTSSSNAVCSKSIKLAVRYAKDQSMVWSGVAEQQGGLGGGLMVETRNEESPTSLELTMENEAVKSASGEYATALGDIIKKRADTLGYVAVINGQISCADTYGSHALFAKLWPKLLDACAVEAVAENGKSKATPGSSLEAVRMFLSAAQAGKVSGERRYQQVMSNVRETDGSMLYETIDSTHNGWVRRNYLAK